MPPAPSTWRRRSRDHPVPEDADPFDLDLDDIARLHRLRRPGSAGVDDVARLEGDELADVADDRRHVEDEILRALRLHDRAVDPGLEQEVAVVRARDDHRTERAEGVRGLRPEPLQIVALPVTFAHIV